LRVILYVLECLDYEYLKTCRTPNINSLNPHPAISFGATTVASIPALLTGYFPICTVNPECPHNTVPRKLVPRHPYFLRKYFGGHVYLYIPNGWVWDLLGSWLDPLMPKLKKWWERFNTQEMVEDFLTHYKNNRDYFVYFHVMETHPPFLEGVKEVKAGSEEWWVRRRKAVELADKILQPLLDLDFDLLIVCSDHNIQHDVASPEGFRTFIGMKTK